MNSLEHACLEDIREILARTVSQSCNESPLRFGHALLEIDDLLTSVVATRTHDLNG